MIRPVLKVEGKRFVVIEERELQQLERTAKSVVAKRQSASQAGSLRGKKKLSGKLSGSDALPALPPLGEDGNRPAVEFARVSIARTMIRDRRAAGLSQEELARLAGVRQETISRIESGKHSPTIRTVEKIDRVLRQAAEGGCMPTGSRKRR
jgi:DNA-binding XRE family transcriptional regulator